MSNLIETNKIEGFSIYGVQMVDYTLDGVGGRDLGSVLALASFASSGAIEKELSAYAEVLKARQKKLDDLGEALAILGKAIANLDPDTPESDDTVRDDNLVTAQTIMARYGVSLNVKSFTFPFQDITYYYITREDAENGRANAEYALNVEDNDMQQDMITMQGLIGKRDNAFSTASKILKKVASTGDSILRSVGQ